MCKQLEGKNLKVLNIHRKGIFDMDALVFSCDNCGRAIVNSATVEDTDTGKVYVIGLDCKKTLIDKKVIAGIEALGGFDVKYKVKDYKAAQNTMIKVLAYLDNDKLEIYASNRDNWFQVIDPSQPNQFGVLGNTIYCENLGYLFKIVLKDVLQAAANKGIIKPN